MKKKYKKNGSLQMEFGGYASSTTIGINTRKYHGLLVAPLSPPAKRHLILAKLDESIVINEKEYPLYSNMSQGYISKRV